MQAAYANAKLQTTLHKMPAKPPHTHTHSYRHTNTHTSDLRDLSESAASAAAVCVRSSLI